MASKGFIKRVRLLQQKKYRKQSNLFVVEGRRAVEEFLKQDYDPVHLVTTEKEGEGGGRALSDDLKVVSPSDMARMTGLDTPCDTLAVFRRKFAYDDDDGGGDAVGGSWRELARTENVNLALDSVRDPGNLGTLIRLCDWFGMRNLIVSSDCCDCFNPKVLRATSGSLARVNVHYVQSLHTELRSLDVPVLGAAMAGTSIYEAPLPDRSSGLVLVMGSEGQGLSEEVSKIVTDFVSIPSYPFARPPDAPAGDPGQPDSAAESLNVAMAAGVLISEIKRRYA